MQGILLCLSLLVPFVLADDDWDDFTNNLATDLAPLITLFGERLTKQFLSESISLLDNIIFALSPLGVLTAVVSVIRVCGSSSLRAFIGRAQEGPSEAESELLPCVSESTAELFNDGGISRVFGRPKIVEVIVWQHEDPVTKKTTSRIGTLRNALCEGAWTQVDKGTELSVEKMHDELPELEIPNLSLNKGIKRRGQGWFYCAAILGTALQLGVMIYAALTVFVYPETFKKDGKAVAGYAFPFYIIGTTFLFVGMFFCAFIIERSSREYYFKPERASKIYWLQPGNQNVGDQVFKSFLATKEGTGGKMTKKLQYIKSTRDSQFEGQYTQIYLTLIFTMLGFIVQFVGLRGLHASVILAQLGSTFVMAIIRTCLRTERMAPSENKLIGKLTLEDDREITTRELTSHKQQELDCFAFHLENVESFDVLVRPTLARQLNHFPNLPVRQSGPESLAKRVIATRAQLAELTSNPRRDLSVAWGDMPIREAARNLTETIETTMDLMSSWGVELGNRFEFQLVFECTTNSSDQIDTTTDMYSISLERRGDALRWTLDTNELEAILGLWTWSLYRSNMRWGQSNLSRLVGLDETEASREETFRYFHKWIFRQTEARMVSPKTVDVARRLFGMEPDIHPYHKDILVLKTNNGLETMAAQDIYIQFLRDAFTHFTELGGEVDVVPGLQNSFLAQSSRVDEMVCCFENCHLGSREDALLCIVPALRHQGLLPDLAADSAKIRRRREKYIENGEWESAFSLLRWLCQRSDGAEFERSVYELGYLCRRAMLESGKLVREKGFEHTCTLLKSDIRDALFVAQGALSALSWSRPQSSTEWWHSFSRQLGWIAWSISTNVTCMKWMQPVLKSLNVPENLYETTETDENMKDAKKSTSALQEWLTLNHIDFEREFFGNEDQMGFAWAVNHGHFALSYFVLVRWTEFGIQIPHLVQQAYSIAASHRSNWAFDVLRQHDADIEALGRGKVSALVEKVISFDLEGIQTLLAHGADPNGNEKARDLRPVILAAQTGQSQILELLVQYGATLEVRDQIGDQIGLSPLQCASRKNRYDTVRLLLSYGEEIDELGSDGLTPLHACVMENQFHMIELLIEKGANINTLEAFLGQTSLMLAARSSSVPIVRLLLDKGADVCIRDEQGRNAMDCAKENPREEIIFILEAAGCV